VRILNLAVVLFGGSLIVANTASAASVSATLFNAVDTPNGVQPGTMDLNVQFGATSIANAYVGQINWHSATSPDWTGNNSPLNSILGPNQTFSTFCIEGTQDVFFGTNETWSLGVQNPSNAPVSPSAPMGATKAAEISELWNRSYNSIGTSNELAAAFQLSVWEIVYDGIPTLGGETAAVFNNGAFQASGDATAINDAVSMLNAIGSGSFTDSYTVFALSDASIQDQIFAVPNGGALPPVPLPEALPMGLALMGGIGFFRVVRRRSL
jgi:hypothetical protein